MERLTGKAPRRRVALVLVVALLCLGGMDAAVCHGDDGHLGIDTRVSSCCESAPPTEAEHGDAVGHPEATTGLLTRATGGSSCEDTPLLQSTAAAQDRASEGIGAGEPVPHFLPPVLCASAGPLLAPPCPCPALSRLQFTALLI